MSRTTAETSNQSPELARYHLSSSDSALLHAVVRGALRQRVLEV
jgi:hypothetical protein